MKKLLIVLILSLTVIFPVFSASVEPLVMLSLALPSFIAFENPGGAVDLSYVADDSVLLLALPEEVKRSEISMKGLLSDKILTVANEALKAALLYAGLDDFNAIGASGTVISSFDMQTLEEEGVLRANVGFEDVDAVYRFGSRTSSASLDGSIWYSVEFLAEPLLSLYIETDDLLISGDSSYQGQELEIRLDLNEEALQAYFNASGYDLMEARRDAILMLMAIADDTYSEAVLGENLSEMTYEEIISALDESNMLDVLDAAAFVIAAMDDPAMDYAGMATMALKPSMYLNGNPIPGVDLEKAMNRFMDIYSLAEMMQ